MEIFSYEFVKIAFSIFVLLGFLYGICSYFIVVRGTGFLGAGVSHTAFGGIALGLLLGISPFFVATIFSLLVIFFISYLAKKTNVAYDIWMGIAFSFSMALGSTLLTLQPLGIDINTYLFGSVLLSTWNDFYFLLLLLIAMILLTAFYFHRIMFVITDEEVAKVSGISTNVFDIVSFLFVTILIILTMKIVGLILVSALLILPSLFGKLFTDNYKYIIILGVLFALFIMLISLVLSLFYNLSPGSLSVIIGVFVYLVCFFIKKK